MIFNNTALRIVRTYEDYSATTGEGTRYVASDGSVWKRISAMEAEFNKSRTAPPATRRIEGDYLL